MLLTTSVTNIHKTDSLMVTPVNDENKMSALFQIEIYNKKIKNK